MDILAAITKKKLWISSKTKILGVKMTFIDKLIGADNKIVLRKIQGDWIPNVESRLEESDKFLLNSRNLVCFLDLETTGLIEKEDKIILYINRIQ